MVYVSESGNCHGVCTKCGEKLNFYIGDFNNSMFLRIINSGSYLLNTDTAYKKINIAPCKGKKKDEPTLHIEGNVLGTKVTFDPINIDKCCQIRKCFGGFFDPDIEKSSCSKGCTGCCCSILADIKNGN